MLERDLQKKCLDYCRSLQKQGKPVVAINQHGSAFSSRGVPDILLCVKGRFMAVELKVGDNRPTPLQEDYLRRIGMAGGMAFVITTYEDFVMVMKYALH